MGVGICSAAVCVVWCEGRRCGLEEARCREGEVMVRYKARHVR